MKEKVNNRLHDIGKQLKAYPDPPPNPELEVMKSLAEFTIRVKVKVLEQSFMGTWDGNFGDPFKKIILSKKPKFNVSENTSTQPARSFQQSEVINLDEDSPVSSPRLGKRTASVMDSTQSTPKRPRGPHPNSVVKSEASEQPVWPATPRHPRIVPPAVTPSRGGRSKSLEDIRALIKRAAIPGQPGLVSATVYEPLFTEAAKTWAPHLESFINGTFSFLQAEILAILDAAFARLKNRAVYKESQEHMRAFIDTHKIELRSQLHRIYNLEAQRLFTKDDETLKRNQDSEMKILVRHRNHCRIAAHSGLELRSVPKMDDMNDEARREEESKMAKELKNLGPDPYERELTVAAYIRGYYLTAANRFVDYVSIHVMSGLLPRVASVIETYLPEMLGLDGQGATHEVLARLMSEGPEIEQKRRDLRAEKETLDGAMDIIVNLERREREQQHAAAIAASHYGNGFDASQAESMSSLEATHVNGVADGRGTVYSATSLGDA